jgi:hypothetical protein
VKLTGVAACAETLATPAEDSNSAAHVDRASLRARENPEVVINAPNTPAPFENAALKDRDAGGRKNDSDLTRGLTFSVIHAT